MTFPTVESVTSANQAAASSISIAYPATNDGDLLIWCVAADLNNTSAITTTESGVTSLTELDTAASAGSSGEVFYKSCDGTETGSVTFNFPGTMRGNAVVCYRISGTSGNTSIGTVAQAADAAPNPPSVTASWGIDDNLWIVFVQSSDDQGTVSAFGTNYGTNGANVTGGDTASEYINIAHSYRTNAAASEDPDAWTLTTGENWAAITIAIEPAAGTTLSAPTATNIQATTATVGCTVTIS